MTSNDDYVLEILKEQGFLTDAQVRQACSALSRPDLSVLDNLIEQGTVTEEQVLQVLAEQFGMEMVSLRDLNLSPELRDTIPGEIARRYHVVPVYRTDHALTVALSDPMNLDVLDNLRHVLKQNVEGVVATRADIRKALDQYYRGDSDIESAVDGLAEGVVDVALPSATGRVVDQTDEADAPIIKLVSLIILEAFRNRASDIHFEPMEKRFRVRYRIDGVLHEVESPSKRLQAAIISRIKIMAGMKISEKRVPQDGRIQVNILGRELDLRVSTVPTNHGESVVMRILDKQNLALGLPNLGFFADDQQLFERLITLPDGIILVTGPTGSGKTTTLYACLAYVNRPDVKIITVEDPVEYQMSGVNQVQVHTEIGLTFASALRSILRQAPNIVMIGEIRDPETARIATEASLTGHLVFSTLHTNDAPSAVTRLLDIGVKPFLVASSLRAVMAQRLVRTICDACKEPYTPTEREIRLLGPTAAQVSNLQLYRGRGCTRCALTGYRGRKGIFEIFQVTDEIRHMIFEKAAAAHLRAKARENGMRTLREDGLRKVAAGLTTVEEILKVTMGDVD